jgi:hypothetical protein
MEIFIYDQDKQTALQLINDCYNDYNPQIQGDQLAWLKGRNHWGTTSEIYTAVPGTSGEISAETGGSITYEKDEGIVTVEIDTGDLASDTIISIIQTVFTDPEVDLTFGTSAGSGNAVVVYDLEPDGMVFDSPVTITIEADVSDLNEAQRGKLGIYI